MQVTANIHPENMHMFILILVLASSVSSLFGLPTTDITPQTTTEEPNILSGVSNHYTATPVQLNSTSTIITPVNSSYKHDNDGITYQVREFYNFAHMANCIQTVDEFLEEGANAIEADVKFDKITGLAIGTHHGSPCDYGRYCEEEEAIIPYLVHLADLATPDSLIYRPSFSGVLWLDLKLDGVDDLFTSGVDFANLLVKNAYTRGSKLKLVLELPHPSHWPFILGLEKGFLDFLKPHLLYRMAVAITGPEYFEELLHLNVRLKLAVWLGDGLPNWLETVHDHEGIRKALSIRDSWLPVCVVKVYRWTRDLRFNMQQDLRFALDAIITNKPHRLYEELHQPEFVEKFRPAQPSDNPFRRITGHGPFHVGCYRVKIVWWKKFLCRKEIKIAGFFTWCWTAVDCTNDRGICDASLSCALMQME